MSKVRVKVGLLNDEHRSRSAEVQFLFGSDDTICCAIMLSRSGYLCSECILLFWIGVNLF